MLLAAACGRSAPRLPHRLDQRRAARRLTLRHAIARSGTNSLEGYFHPRQLAFAFGVLAVAAFLRGRLRARAALVLAAGSLHPTTTLWFTVWVAVATVATAADARRRWPQRPVAALRSPPGR